MLSTRYGVYFQHDIADSMSHIGLVFVTLQKFLLSNDNLFHEMTIYVQMLRKVYLFIRNSSFLSGIRYCYNHWQQMTWRMTIIQIWRIHLIHAAIFNHRLQISDFGWLLYLVQQYQSSAFSKIFSFSMSFLHGKYCFNKMPSTFENLFLSY